MESESGGEGESASQIDDFVHIYQVSRDYSFGKPDAKPMHEGRSLRANAKKKVCKVNKFNVQICHKRKRVHI